MRPTVSLILVFTTSFVAAQQIATTDAGKKVRLYENGKWEYVVEEINKPDVECDKWVKTTTDKVTGTTSLSSKNDLIISKTGKGGIVVYSLASGQMAALVFHVMDSPCIDKDSKINILFLDGSRLELTSNSKFNCDGTSSVYFGGSFGNESALAELTTKPIETIRVHTSKSFAQEDLDKNQSIYIANTLTCLSK